MKDSDLIEWVLSQYLCMGAPHTDLIREYTKLCNDKQYLNHCLKELDYENINI